MSIQLTIYIKQDKMSIKIVIYPLITINCHNPSNQIVIILIKPSFWSKIIIRMSMKV